LVDIKVGEVIKVTFYYADSIDCPNPKIFYMDKVRDIEFIGRVVKSNSKLISSRDNIMINYKKFYLTTKILKIIYKKKRADEDRLPISEGEEFDLILENSTGELLDDSFRFEIQKLCNDIAFRECL
jgi:hypothetical protein